MTQNEFRVRLKEFFGLHVLMNKRDKHTINELLYVLEHNDAFKDMDFNITIVKLDGGCYCIPSLDVFVCTQVRAMWFEDDKVEFEIEEWEIIDGLMAKTNCITIYESEGM